MGLTPDDLIVGGRRDFPASIARGHRFRAILRAAVGGEPLGGAAAELIGRGPGRASVAVGRALAARLQQSERVVLSFFGTAAVRDGSALGAIRAARDVNAPVIFVARGPLSGDPPLTHIDAALGVNVKVMLADDGTELRRAVVNTRPRVAQGGGPVVFDARFGESPAVARDTQRLQSAGQLSAEFERAVNDEIRAALWEARNLVEGGPS